MITLSNLKYADQSNTAIDMTVTGWIATPIPFTYHPSDGEPLSVVVRSMLAHGDYSIGAYVKPATQIKAEIDGYRDARLAAGYADATTGKTWQCDDRSIARWTAIAASVQPWALGLTQTIAPTLPPLIAADNTAVTLSAADAYALLQGRIMAWVSATVLYARTLKDQVDAGAPPADITVGWPT